MTIRSTHFNFIKYTITCQVDETVVESYVLLAKLWQGILGLVLTPSLRAEIEEEEAPSSSPILEWAKAVAGAQTELEQAAQAAPNQVFLEKDDIKTVKDKIGSLTKALGKVMQKYERASQFRAFADYEQYMKVKAFHDTVLTRLDAYVELASLTVGGQVKTIPKKKGGTVVTVTMTLVASAGAERPPTLTVEYFSHSRLPLTLHAGCTWARLREVEFEKVAAFAGSDMFARIKSNDNTQAFTAFITYEPKAWLEDRVGAGIAIGTDVVKPGQRLFVGRSVRYTRFVFSYGGMSGELKEGVDPVIEHLGDGSTRQVFGAIATRRDWGQLFAISVKVF